jgi:hypothetical protein
MNELNEQAFWLELFAVRIRHEERRRAALQANLELTLRKAASDRKVVQISTVVHAEKDWAFIALCDDGSLWLYHGSWSRIENMPLTTNTLS